MDHQSRPETLDNNPVPRRSPTDQMRDKGTGQDQEPENALLNIAPRPAGHGKVTKSKHLAGSVTSVTSCYSRPACSDAARNAGPLPGDPYLEAP